VVRRPEIETDSSHQHSAEVKKSAEILPSPSFKDIWRGDKLITRKTFRFYGFAEWYTPMPATIKIIMHKNTTFN